jgi:hypothetical protein
MNSGWTFSSQQRRGLIVLAGLIILLAVGRFAWKKWSQPQAIDASAPLPFVVEKDSSFIEKKRSEPSTNTHAFRRKKQLPKPGTIDLNTTTPEALEQLPGIGPTFSQRIIRYRDAIGGFDSVAQLKKVYGLPPETYQEIQAVFFLSEKEKKVLYPEKVLETVLI